MKRVFIGSQRHRLGEYELAGTFLDLGRGMGMVDFRFDRVGQLEPNHVAPVECQNRVHSFIVAIFWRASAERPDFLAGAEGRNLRNKLRKSAPSRRVSPVAR